MTEHLSIAMILRHMAKLNLAHVSGRSEAAAKLHTLMEVEAPQKSVSFSQAEHHEVDAEMELVQEKSSLESKQAEDQVKQEDRA